MLCSVVFLFGSFISKKDMAIQLSLPFTCNHQIQPFFFSPVCSLTKQGHRLLTSLDIAAGDDAASHRLVSKFIASSSKSIALSTFTHLLSSDIRRHSSLALPMYKKITQTPWFTWNSKLVSNLIASLEKQGFTHEANILISESIQKLGFRGQDVALFYTDLIHFFSKYGLKESVFDFYSRLIQLLSTSSNSSLKRKAFETMINALCLLDLPSDAQGIMKEMSNAGVKPSGFEFRLIVLAYGRLGLFEEMKRVVDEMEKFGYGLDTVCFNVILSSYGIHGELLEMVSLIQRMKSSNTPFSVRTYNTVLNSCPTIIAMLQDSKSIPLSTEELVTILPRDEALLVGELMNSLVLTQTLGWSSLEGKLDLHGMHLGTVYVIMLMWIEELRSRFCGDETITSTEITVVCGLGKHSSVRGESPVKALVSDMLVRLNSPMRIDRKNIGCFVAKGKSVRDWLC